jgi:uncharacterized protein
MQELADELGERAHVLPADLSSSDDVRRLAGEAGDVDVLVANAGIPGTGKLTEYTPEQVDRVLDVNLNSVVHLTHALLPRMLERGSGHLVYVSSMSGKVASPRSSLYNATKFGMRGFAHAVHEDLRGTGVGCTVVLPGFIDEAGMWADGGLKTPPGSGGKKPEDVAAAVMKAIDKNPHEIVVSGFIPRVGGALYGLAPSLVQGMQRRGGGEKTVEQLAEAQKTKR